MRARSPCGMRARSPCSKSLRHACSKSFPTWCNHIPTCPVGAGHQPRRPTTRAFHAYIDLQLLLHRHRLQLLLHRHRLDRLRTNVDRLNRLNFFPTWCSFAASWVVVPLWVALWVVPSRHCSVTLGGALGGAGGAVLPLFSDAVQCDAVQCVSVCGAGWRTAGRAIVEQLLLLRAALIRRRLFGLGDLLPEGMSWVTGACRSSYDNAT